MDKSVGWEDEVLDADAADGKANVTCTLTQ